MTVLLIGVFLGIKHGQIKLGQMTTLLALVAGILLPFVVSSRSSIAAVALIMLAVLFVARRTGNGIPAVRLAVFGALLVTVLVITASSWLPTIGNAPMRRLEFTIAEFRKDPLSGYHGLGRPFYAWTTNVSKTRIAESPIIGSGAEGIVFHNDWLTVLAASGVVGLLLFMLIVMGMARIELVFLVPLLTSAMTSTFVLIPQALSVFMLLVGTTWALKREAGYSRQTFRRRASFRDRIRDVGDSA